MSAARFTMRAVDGGYQILQVLRHLTTSDLRGVDFVSVFPPELFAPEFFPVGDIDAALDRLNSLNGAGR